MSSLTLVIGRNSFFANCFVAACAGAAVRHVSLADMDRPDALDGVGTVVNFSFNPRLYSEPYSPALDVDRQIAQKVERHSIRYVLLSSRTVYGPAVKWNASEEADTAGDGVYGANRVAVEEAVVGRLGWERVAVVRLANTIGYELQDGRRQSFMSQLLTSLRERAEIHFDMAPSTRRDFVTDEFLCRVLWRLVESGATGIFNVGCGFPVRTGDIADWILAGFGKGRLVADSQEVRDEFYLDTTKLRRTAGLAMSREELRDRCLAIGRRLAGA